MGSVLQPAWPGEEYNPDPEPFEPAIICERCRLPHAYKTKPCFVWCDWCGKFRHFTYSTPEIKETK